MSINTPDSKDRFAVVSPSLIEISAGDVSFWEKWDSVLSLMTRFANADFSRNMGFSVWHRRTATSQWKLITA